MLSWSGQLSAKMSRGARPREFRWGATMGAASSLTGPGDSDRSPVAPWIEIAWGKTCVRCTGWVGPCCKEGSWPRLMAECGRLWPLVVCCLRWDSHDR